MVLGRFSHPRNLVGYNISLGVKQVMQCIHYFPVDFKTKHFRYADMRQYVAKLHGKDFLQVWMEATEKTKVESWCYCHNSLMCNYVWYHHRNEYAWHLQHHKLAPQTLPAMVSTDYFEEEIKMEEKIPFPSVSMHIRHFMMNGVYQDAKIPSKQFVDQNLIEGLCYSFGFQLCDTVVCSKFQ